jgi:hypothetical protein
MLIETKNFTIDVSAHSIKTKNSGVSLDDFAAEINQALATNMLPPMLEIKGSKIKLLPKVSLTGAL